MLALAAYQGKRFDEAYGLTRKALEETPDNPACLHLMGMLEFGVGHGDEAEKLMRRAMTIKPGFSEALFCFAQVLAARGKHAEAAEHYEKTIALKPNHAEALFGLGNARAQMGQRDAAVEAYEKALQIKPDYPEALNNLGVFLFEKGDYARAIGLYEHALRLRPDYAAAYNNLGNVFKEQQEWAKAIHNYRRACVLDPNLAEAHNNMGLALLYGASDIDAAAACFRQSLAIAPTNLAAMTHLGITLCMQGQFSKSLEWYDKALALNRDYRDALNNKANALKALGRVEEAIAYYDRVKEINPDDPEIHNNMAMAYLALGRFDEGWEEYEYRWDTAQLKAGKRSYPQPQWRGEESKGRTLLIHAEQGFGDTLQFCRYVPLAAARGWKILFEVQKELVSLMASIKGEAMIFPAGGLLPPFDMHCPMLSLPRAFGTTVDTIPANVPYLHADETKATFWRERLAKDPEGLKVGLVWSGNPRLFSVDLSAANARRSLSPEALAPLAGLEGVQFYSLQKDAEALDRDFLSPSGLNMIDHMSYCADFSDTAAFMANLDLIISVDTAPAHLAGALGKPVWLLNRFDTCWRWFLDRDDSPWYPTLRQFRQPNPGDWLNVIERVRQELLSKAFRSAP